MNLRLFVSLPLCEGAEVSLPAGPARHAQVRRVQPGDTVLLFDGRGQDWPATVLAMGKAEVRVRIGAVLPVRRELPWPVTLALAMPANERMDTLVEKATELGAGRIQPLHTERSVLRLQGERAARKREHWQAIAQGACEQCGRAIVPEVAPVALLGPWLQSLPPQRADQRLLLSLTPGALGLAGLGLPATVGTPLVTLSGPEGGLTAEEEAAARKAGFLAADLGPRVLRAETAPLAVLAWLALQPAGIGGH
jgi:16S rRNA (uracil1498-N3)-methyltransferase